MEMQLSRRDFLVGAGTGAVAGAIVAGLDWSRVRPRPRIASSDSCCAPAEHEGWLVTPRDKERLQRGLAP